jgi:hypothetical protein
MSGFTLIVSNYDDMTETVFDTHLNYMSVEVDINKYSMNKKTEEIFEVKEFKCLFDAREYIMNFLVSIGISNSDDGYPITLRSANYKIKDNVIHYFNEEHGDFDYYYNSFFSKVLVSEEEKSDISDVCGKLMSMKI